MTLSTAMSTFGFGSLVFLLVLSHSSGGISRSRTKETNSSGSSQSVPITKVLQSQSFLSALIEDSMDMVHSTRRRRSRATSPLVPRELQGHSSWLLQQYHHEFLRYRQDCRYCLVVREQRQGRHGHIGEGGRNSAGLRRCSTNTVCHRTAERRKRVSALTICSPAFTGFVVTIRSSVGS